MAPDTPAPPMAWLMRLPAFVLLQVLLLGLGLMSLAWNAVAVVLQRLLPEQRARWVGRAAISRLYGFFWRVTGWFGMMEMDASALDPLAAEPGLVVVANHPSLLDAMMLVAHLPRSACVMKASLVRNPFLGPGARLARYIGNDSASRMVRQAVDDLRTGGQLVMFPEGTRTTRAPVNPFRPGFALIAKLAKSPIQAVVIDTDSPYLGKGWPLWQLPPLPIRFSVRLGPRFEPGTDPNALTREVEAFFAHACTGHPLPHPHA